MHIGNFIGDRAFQNASDMRGGICGKQQGFKTFFCSFHSGDAGHGSFSDTSFTGEENVFLLALNGIQDLIVEVHKQPPFGKVF